MYEGFELQNVLDHFHKLIRISQVLVAHNMSFDEKIVGSEFLRNGFQNSIPPMPKICTMQSTTNYCKINGNYGYKWPKLSELHYKLFGFEFEEAHNAMVDINATAKCFWELKKIGVIK
jgi:DNA polymerase III subunit epsilon